jgi:flagellar hook-length control protein FliK
MSVEPTLLLAAPASPPSSGAPPGTAAPPGGTLFQSALDEQSARTANAEGHEQTSTEASRREKPDERHGANAPESATGTAVAQVALPQAETATSAASPTGASTQATGTGSGAPTSSASTSSGSPVPAGASAPGQSATAEHAIGEHASSPSSVNEGRPPASASAADTLAGLPQDAAQQSAKRAPSIATDGPGGHDAGKPSGPASSSAGVGSSAAAESSRAAGASLSTSTSTGASRLATSSPAGTARASSAAAEVLAGDRAAVAAAAAGAARPAPGAGTNTESAGSRTTGPAVTAAHGQAPQPLAAQQSATSAAAASLGSPASPQSPQSGLSVSLSGAQLPGNAASSAHATPASANTPGVGGEGAGANAEASANNGGGASDGAATNVATLRTPITRAAGRPRASGAAAPAQTAAPAPAATAAAGSAANPLSMLEPGSAPLASAAGAGAGANTSAAPGVGMHEMIESINATLEIAVRQGATQARIALHPEELGQINVRLSQTSQGLLARVSAETPAAAQALAAGRAELHQSLSSLGVSLLRLDISFGQSETGEREGRFTGDAHSSGASGSSRAPSTPEALDSAEALAQPDGPARSASLSGGALVDVLA